MSDRMNEAQKRIWADDANFTEVAAVPDQEVRVSEEALEILREQGVDAYEQYVSEHSKK